MKFEELLTKLNKLESNIVKIYFGGDNVCRCGCRGSYFYKDKHTDDFNKCLRRLKTFIYNIEEGKYFVHNRKGSFDMMIDNTFINIPVNSRGIGKCYCIYFRD